MRKVTVSTGELRRYTAAVEAYRAFRAQRRQVLQAQARMRALLKALEEALRIEPPCRPASAS